MKKIMIDLDDTICQGGYLEILNDYFNTNYTYDDLDDYYVESLVPDGKLDEYLDYFYSGKVNVYDYSKPLPDAIEVIEKLSKVYDIYICSAYVDRRRVRGSGVMALFKHDWIIRNLPFIDPKKIILTGSKELVSCDIKIDDKFSNLKGCSDIKLLLDAYHNRDYDDDKLKSRNVRRVKSWREIEDILLDENVIGE